MTSNDQMIVTSHMWAAPALRNLADLIEQDEREVAQVSLVRDGEMWVAIAEMNPRS
jgi:hypothetical protein